MKDKAGLFIAYVCLGVAIEGLNELIESFYLNDFYKTPFFTVLVTMTVFSFTLFSYISGKISKLELKYGCLFENTRRELKDAFQILVSLDIIFLVLLILCFSKLSDNLLTHFILMSALNTLFICVIHILIDLGKAIFKMFENVGKFNELDNVGEGKH